MTSLPIIRRSPLLTLALAFALVGLPPSPARAADPPFVCPASDRTVEALYGLRYSIASDRRDPLRLEGATAPSPLYAFIEDPSTLAAVDYWVDRPATGSPNQHEKLDPYDVAGGSSSTANPLPLVPGGHFIVTRLYFVAGGEATLCTTFSVAPGAAPDCAPYDVATEPYALQWSAFEDRRGPRPLQHTTLARMPFYPFIDAPTGVRGVHFWIDRTATGTPDRNEKQRPYDVGGGSFELARPVSLPDGTHRIFARVVRTDDSERALCTTFTVAVAAGCADADHDGACDAFDNCPDDANTDQQDVDGDELGDVCDPDPLGDVAPPPADARYPIRYSHFADRRAAVPLHDALVVAVPFYPFIDHPSDIFTVAFFIDGPPLGLPDQFERGRPYDVAGGSIALARPLDLPDGDHVIFARIALRDGREEIIAASFAVARGGVVCNNVPPVLDAGAALNGDEGSALVLSGPSLADAGTPGNYEVDIDWGDGGGQEPWVPGRTHVYTNEGVFEATLCVHDCACNVCHDVCDTTSVTVRNVAPTGPGDAGVITAEGALNGGVATVATSGASGTTDPGPLDVVTFRYALSLDGGATYGAEQTSPAFEGVAATGAERYRIRARATDGVATSAGFAETAVLSLDRTAPALSVTAPPDGTVSSDPDVVVSGSVSDHSAVTVNIGSTTVIPDPTGTFERTVTLSPGANTLVVTARDASGNTREVTLTVTFAGTLEVLIDAPADGTATSDADVEVRGRVRDTQGQGVAGSVTVGGRSVSVTAGAFSLRVPLLVGDNVLRVTATSGGATGQASVRVRRLGDGEGTPDGGPGTGTDAPGPGVTINVPRAATVADDARVRIAGTVNAPAGLRQLEVAGRPANVDGTSFTLDVTFGEGPQAVTAVATDTLGREARAQVEFTVDTLAPVVTIVEPPGSPFTATTSPIVVRGTAVDETLAGVSVAGRDALLAGTLFTALVPLVQGRNTVAVVARDLAGHTTQQTLLVDLAAEPPDVRIVAPADNAVIATAETDVIVTAAAPGGLLDVSVNGAPASPAGEAGVFRRTVSLTAGLNTLTAVATGANGITASHTVTVTRPDPASEPLRVLRVDPEADAAEVALTTLVTFYFNKPVRTDSVAGAITARTGTGDFVEGGVSFDATGILATFVAGAPYPAASLVTIELDTTLLAAEGPGLAAPHRTQFFTTPTPTILRGVVYSEDGYPLQGATVTAVDREGRALSRTVKTGPLGDWALEGLTPGEARIEVDGTKVATTGGHYPRLVVPARVVAREVRDADPVNLVLFRDGSAVVHVTGIAQQTLRIPDVTDGFALEVSPGTVVFPDGSSTGSFQLVPAPRRTSPYRTVAPFMGRQLLMASPFGIELTGTPRLTLPNFDRLLPGTRVLITALDYDSLQMSVAGTGTVDEHDPLLIYADDNLQLRHFAVIGWQGVDDEVATSVADGLAALRTSGGSGGDEGGSWLPRDGLLPMEPYPMHSPSPLDLLRRGLRGLGDILLPEAHAQFIIQEALGLAFGLGNLLRAIYRVHVVGEVRTPNRVAQVPDEEACHEGLGEVDPDEDGIFGICDKCPYVADFGADQDNDGLGDKCDPKPDRPYEVFPGIVVADEGTGQQTVSCCLERGEGEGEAAGVRKVARTGRFQMIIPMLKGPPEVNVPGIGPLPLPIPLEVPPPRPEYQAAVAANGGEGHMIAYIPFSDDTQRVNYFPIRSFPFLYDLPFAPQPVIVPVDVKFFSGRVCLVRPDFNDPDKKLIEVPIGDDTIYDPETHDLLQVSREDMLATRVRIFRAGASPEEVGPEDVVREGPLIEAPPTLPGFPPLPRVGPPPPVPFFFYNVALFGDFHQDGLPVESFVTGTTRLNVQPGEQFYFTAVNERTGFTGVSTRNETFLCGFTGAKERLRPTFTSAGTLGEIHDVVLTPPFVFVGVVRQHQVQGAGERFPERAFVPHEGVALSSDDYVSVYTEWQYMDWRGQLQRFPAGLPLPELTARHMSIESGGGGGANQTEVFTIPPEEHLQTVLLPATSAGFAPAHQYIHVVAVDAQDEVPPFEDDPALPGRPLKAIQLNLLPFGRKEEPKRRAEFMYSIYDAGLDDVRSISRSSGEVTGNLAEPPGGRLAFSADELDVLYHLTAPPGEPIEPLSFERRFLLETSNGCEVFLEITDGARRLVAFRSQSEGDPQQPDPGSLSPECREFLGSNDQSGVPPQLPGGTVVDCMSVDDVTFLSLALKSDDPFQEYNTLARVFFSLAVFEFETFDANSASPVVTIPLPGQGSGDTGCEGEDQGGDDGDEVKPPDAMHLCTYLDGVLSSQTRASLPKPGEVGTFQVPLDFSVTQIDQCVDSTRMLITAMPDGVACPPLGDTTPIRSLDEVGGGVLAAGRVYPKLVLARMVGRGSEMVENVDVRDGHMVFSSVDFDINAPGYPLRMARTYTNTNDETRGAMGRGWRHEHETFALYQDCRSVTIVGGSGGGLTFSAAGAPPSCGRAASGWHFAPPPEEPGASLEMLGYECRTHGPNGERLQPCREECGGSFAVTNATFKVTLADGTVHFFERPVEGGQKVMLTRVEHPVGYTMRYTYDSRDRLCQVFDASGNRHIEFDYTEFCTVPLLASAELKTGAVAVGPRAACVRGGTPVGMRFDYDYDGRGRLVSATWAGCRTEHYRHGGADNPYRIEEIVFPDGSTRGYEYGDDGNDEDGDCAVTPGNDPAKQVRRVRRGDGSTVEFDYSPGSTSVRGPRHDLGATVYGFDGEGWLRRVESPIDDGRVGVQLIDWDTRAARRTRLVDELGRATTYEYDARGNLVREVTEARGVAGKSDAVDGAGSPIGSVEKRWTWDPRFRVRTSFTNLGGNTQTWTLDPGTGLITDWVALDGGITHYAYDHFGQATRVEDPEHCEWRLSGHDTFGYLTVAELEVGPGASVVIHTTYDALGNIVLQETSRSGGPREFLEWTYDACNRRAGERRGQRSVTADADVRARAWEYSVSGQVTREVIGITDPSEDCTPGAPHCYSVRYEYDLMQRTTRTESVVDADTRYVVMNRFDEAGNVVEVVDARGVTTRTTYDGLQKPLTVHVGADHDLEQGLVGDVVGIGGLVERSSYDLAGNLVQACNAQGRCTDFAYDALYRAVRAIHPPVPDVDGALIRYHTDFRYDREDRVTWKKNENGGILTIDRDALGQVLREAHAGGQVVTYTYDLRGLPTRIEQRPEGLVETIAYDCLERATAHARTYTVAAGPEPGLRVETTTWLYDDAARTIVVTKADGSVEHRTENVHTEPVLTVLDPGGLDLRRALRYDTQGHVVERIDEVGNSTLIGRDPLGRAITTTNALGHSQVMQYDAEGRIIATSDLGPTLDGGPVRYCWRFDALGRERALLLVTGGGSCAGATTVLQEYRYDDAGQREVLIDARGAEWTTTLDALARPLHRLDPRGGAISWRYDGLDMRSQRDPLGRESTFEYDLRGRLTAVTSSFGAQGRRSTYVYDDATLTMTETSPRGVVTTRRNDPRSRLVEKTTGVERVQLGFDALDRTTVEVWPDGMRLVHEYDAAGRMTALVFDAGGPNESRDQFDRDPRGWVVRDRMPIGRGTTGLLTVDYERDAVGSLTRITTSDGQTEAWDYEPNGRETRFVDGNGHATLYEWDPQGFLTRVVTPDGAVHVERYNLAGDPVLRQDGRGGIHRFDYNEVGLLTRTVQYADVHPHLAPGDPLPSVTAADAITTTEYDAAYNVTRYTDAAGRATTQDYDGFYDVTRIAYSGPGVAPAPALVQVDYEYDGHGLVTTIVEHRLGGGFAPDTETTRYEYDEHDRVTRKTLPDGAALRWEYDPRGNPTRYTGTAGDVTTYTYDSRGRLSSIDAPQGRFTQTWYPDSHLATETYPSGVVRRYTRRDDAVVTAIEYVDAAGARLARYDYFFDGADRIVEERAEQTDPAAPDGPRFSTTTRYAYDAGDRLVAVERPPAPGEGGVRLVELYAYDLADNRVGRKVAPATAVDFTGATTAFDAVSGGELLEHQAYTYDGTNRLLAVTDAFDPARSTTYASDLAGFTLAATTNGQTTTYGWDHRGALVTVTLPDSRVARFDTDHAERRVREWHADGTALSFVHDRRRLVEERDATVAGQPVVRRYVNPGRMLAVSDFSSGTRIDRQMFTDLRGSVVNVIDADAQVRATNTYAPFGARMSEMAAPGEVVDASELPGYASRRHDAETALIDYGARSYDPSLGRFVSQDTYLGTVDDPDTWHAYAFAANDPIAKGDFDGHFFGSMTEGAIWGAGLGYEIGASLWIHNEEMGFGEGGALIAMLGTAGAVGGGLIASLFIAIEILAVGPFAKWFGQQLGRFFGRTIGKFIGQFIVEFLWEFGLSVGQDLTEIFLRQNTGLCDETATGTGPCKFEWNWAQRIAAAAMGAAMSGIMDSLGDALRARAVGGGGAPGGRPRGVGGADPGPHGDGRAPGPPRRPVDGPDLADSTPPRGAGADGAPDPRPARPSDAGQPGRPPAAPDGPGAPNRPRGGDADAPGGPTRPGGEPDSGGPQRPGRGDYPEQRAESGTPGREDGRGPTGCRCFTPDTLVMTSEGPRRIGDVAPGDAVLAADTASAVAATTVSDAPSAARTPRLRRVTRVFRSVAAALVVLGLGQSSVGATPGHPFWVEGEGWVHASEIQPGDRLSTADGAAIAVEDVAHDVAPHVVVNLEVEGDHTYFVGEEQVLVHNASLCDVREKMLRNKLGDAEFETELRRAMKQQGLDAAGALDYVWNTRDKKRSDVNVQGHHVPAVKKAEHLIDIDRKDKDHPTYYPDDARRSHWRLHDSELFGPLGPTQGAFSGDVQALYKAYREAYKHLKDIRGDVRTQNGTVLARNVTPYRAVRILFENIFPGQKFK